MVSVSLKVGSWKKIRNKPPLRKIKGKQKKNKNKNKEPARPYHNIRSFRHPTCHIPTNREVHTDRDRQKGRSLGDLRARVQLTRQHPQLTKIYRVNGISAKQNGKKYVCRNKVNSRGGRSRWFLCRFLWLGLCLWLGFYLWFGFYLRLVV